MASLPNPSYANIANCRRQARVELGVYPASGNVSIRLNITNTTGLPTQNRSGRTGFRARFVLIQEGNPTTTIERFITEGRYVYRYNGPNDASLLLVVSGRVRRQIQDQYIQELDISVGADRWDFLPQYPFIVRGGNEPIYEIYDTLDFYNMVEIGVTVSAISADMYELMYEVMNLSQNVPVFLDIPDEVIGQTETPQSIQLDRTLNTIQLPGRVDNRILGAWKFSFWSSRSLPVVTEHAHFEPFVSPTEMQDLTDMGVSVYIDEFGLVHFENNDDFERYLAAHISAARFNRSWIAAKPSAISGYTAAAAEIPDKLVAAKSAMKDRYNSAIDSDAYEDKLQRYRNPEVLTELFTSKLDSIVSINQAKLEKVVRSVETKRDLAARLNGIIEYYRTNPDSTVILPTGLSDSVLRSLISQPLSKMMRKLNNSGTDAYLGEAIAEDLIGRLGFGRRVVT